MIKIAGATARICEQHNWCARTAKCAFQRRVTDVDASMLLQSHLPLLCRCNHKASAWKMHANLADLTRSMWHPLLHRELVARSFGFGCHGRYDAGGAALVPRQ